MIRIYVNGNCVASYCENQSWLAKEYARDVACEYPDAWVELTIDGCPIWRVRFNDLYGTECENV